MKTPRRQPRDVADFARLLTALKADEDHSLASRITRDEAVRRSQSDELESSERIWQWLEHVDADGRRLAHETRALLARISLSMAVAGEAIDLARKALGSDVRIAADVLVKHATPPGPVDLAQVARDTWQRGRADALIVTGSGTGQPTDPAELGVVRAAVPDAPVWVGSGVTPDNARGLRADAAIVGTWLHQNADLRRPLDPERVAALRAALR